MLEKIRLNNGLFNGVHNKYGMFIWDTGDIYVGEMSDNLFVGEGLLIKREEYLLMGKFKEGQLDGHQKLVVKDKGLIELDYKKTLLQEVVIIQEGGHKVTVNIKE